VFAEHGPVLRALADAAADDPDVELVYHRLVQSFIDVTARYIRLEMAAGRVHGLEPVETATALVWMMERYLTLGPAREPQPERRMLAGTLEILWARVLYGAG
jgi:hypothetical protein